MSTSRPNNSLRMKQKNRSLILRLIRAQGCSRAELARATGLTRAAVSLIVESLIEEGLIAEGEQMHSEAGRHPTSLCINASARYAAGIDISREGCSIGVADLSGRILNKKMIPASETPQKTVDDVSKELLLLLSEYPEDLILGVGICVPGPVDLEKGTILLPPGMSLWHNFNVVQAFTQQLKLPVFLEKDTNALALAEKNTSENPDNFLFLLADHGLGCGLVQNGKVFKGFGGFGCELGHISIDLNGPLCSCGNRGCAELYVSIPATVEMAQKEGLKIADWQELNAQAEVDPVCRKVLQNQADKLAIACVNAVNLMEPETIVLGGALAHGGSLLREYLESALRKQCMTRWYHKVYVKYSTLPVDARTVAAAGLALEDFFYERIKI